MHIIISPIGTVVLVTGVFLSLIGLVAYEAEFCADLTLKLLIPPPSQAEARANYLLTACKGASFESLERHCRMLKITICIKINLSFIY
jgi:hypothetical protein